jgi:hypothetical protein
MLRSFDKFERDLNDDACVVVSAILDLADGAARAAAGCHISIERDVRTRGHAPSSGGRGSDSSENLL